MNNNIVMATKVLLGLSILNIIPFSSSIIKTTMIVIILMMILEYLIYKTYKIFELKYAFIICAVLLSSPFLYTIPTNVVFLKIISTGLWILSLILCLLAYRTYLKIKLLLKREQTKWM
ncbi:hypothetical protein [Mycoplasma sp. P36-A1]|uniref:hypothetical protein n=1 Tax=Mycoplasma sp. P36-A1 TaxID=3252900 RepID=UPI003C2DE7E3